MRELVTTITTATSCLLHIAVYSLTLRHVWLNLLLVVLQGRLHLQALLQVKERRVLQATVAHQVVELVPRLDDVQVQDVVQTDDILLFENTDVAIDVQVFQVLLPHVKANDSDNVT